MGLLYLLILLCFTVCVLLDFLRNIGLRSAYTLFTCFPLGVVSVVDFGCTGMGCVVLLFWTFELVGLLDYFSFVFVWFSVSKRFLGYVINLVFADLPFWSVCCGLLSL